MSSTGFKPIFDKFPPQNHGFSGFRASLEDKHGFALILPVRTFARLCCVTLKWKITFNLPKTWWMRVRRGQRHADDKVSKHRKLASVHRGQAELRAKRIFAGAVRNLNKNFCEHGVQFLPKSFVVSQTTSRAHDELGFIIWQHLAHVGKEGSQLFFPLVDRFCFQWSQNISWDSNVKRLRSPSVLKKNITRERMWACGWVWERER
jgi:hypothetical protein